MPYKTYGLNASQGLDSEGKLRNSIRLERTIINHILV